MYKAIKCGEIISGEVSKIFKTTVLISLPDKYNGVLHISDISDYYIQNINYFFSLNRTYDFYVKSIDHRSKIVNLSWKKITPRFLKDPFDFIIMETKHGFNNIIKKIKEDIQND